MIQPAVPSLSVALGLPVEPAQPPLGGGSKDTDFRSFLNPAADQPDARQPDPSRIAPGASAPGGPATPPAEPGKILPLGLPVALSVQPGPTPIEPVPVLPTIQVPPPAKPSRKTNLAPVSEVLPPEAKLQAPPELEPASPAGTGDPIPVSEVLSPAAKPMPAALPGAVIPPDLPVEPAPAAPHLSGTGQPAPQRRSGMLHRSIPDLPTVASPQAHARNAAHRADAGPAAVPATSTVQSVPSQPASPHAPRPDEIRLELGLPRRFAATTPIRDEPRSATPVHDFARPDAGLAQPVQVAPSLAPPPTPVGLTAAPRPQDFSALVERIVAAREAAAPQAVSITLAHQEFGPVRLNFQAEDAGLAVSMTSPDPDFARAAAAAPAPVLAVPASDPSNLGRSDGAAPQSGSQFSAHGGQAQAQSQGGTSGQSRRDAQGQSPAQPAPRGEPQLPAARGGVFA